jgi:hypothetical protein
MPTVRPLTLDDVQSKFPLASWAEINTSQVPESQQWLTQGHAYSGYVGTPHHPLGLVPCGQLHGVILLVVGNLCALQR